MTSLSEEQIRRYDPDSRTQLIEHCEGFRKALNALVDFVEETRDDTEGQWPEADPGCIDCTVGTVPNRLNTGPCAYHKAKRLLGRS